MSTRLHPYRRALCMPLALAATLSLGCSKSAIVYGTHGAAIEGRIVGSDADSITVDVDGVAHVVPREGIRDIDHPGTGWLLFGALNTAAAVACGVGAGAVWYGHLRSGSRDVDDRLEAEIGTAVLIIAGVIPLLVGVPTAIWGGTTWHDSQERAEAPAPATTVHVGPGGVLVRF